MNETNDIILTEQRQAHQAKYGIEKGFAFHIVISETPDEHIKAFFTKSGLERYLEELEKAGVPYQHRIVYADDAREVSYKC